MTASALATIDYEESTAAAEDRPHPTPHLCLACGSRPARFQYRGIVKADRHHNLCFKCYRSTLDSIRNVERATGAPRWLGTRRLPRALDRVLETGNKYEDLARRRRRAQMAARHALERQEGRA